MFLAMNYGEGKAQRQNTCWRTYKKYARSLSAIARSVAVLGWNRGRGIG